MTTSVSVPEPKEKKYYPFQEKIVNVLVEKTQSTNYHFFRLLTAYHLAQAAAMMRAIINTKDRGLIPVNLYVLNLAISGFGKNHSLNILEDLLMSGFKRTFLDDLFPTVAKVQLAKLAEDKSLRDGIEMDAAMSSIQSEFAGLGALAFNFDSGTVPAIKQMRHKLLMANAGSINFICDEIGSNLLGNQELLTAYLELYDVGSIKQKLIKNTRENIRSEELEGRTPTNAMLFGTPDKLLDGGKIEQEFDTMLISGYARRLMFGFTAVDNKPKDQTAEELYDKLTDNSLSNSVNEIHNRFTSLANMDNFNSQLDVSKEVTIELLQYKLNCEEKARNMGSHEEIHKTQMMHRYFNALKLAGTYAFADQSKEINSDHLEYAINLTEDCGDHFVMIQKRERPYVRLAKYLADIDYDATMVDLVEELPFFKGTDVAKKQLLTLATEYGYRHNIILRQKEIDGINFISGEALEETDIDQVTISYSKDIAQGYKEDKVKFFELPKLINLPDYHYTAHTFLNGHRISENVIQGFNLLILDVDEGTTIEVARGLLQDFSYIVAPTKRHTSKHHRFRLIMPLSHRIKLDSKGYSRFMENVFAWLPFKVDEAPKDIARKWLTNPSTEIYVNQGETIDATLFIPKTQRARKQIDATANSVNMNKLQRWFAKNISIGNRSSMLYRYGACLHDSGKDLAEISAEIRKFNAKIEDPLHEDEITNTIIISLAQKYSNKQEEK